MWECLEKKFEKLEAKARSVKMSNKRSVWDNTLADLNLLVHGPWLVNASSYITFSLLIYMFF